MAVGVLITAMELCASGAFAFDHQHTIYAGVLRQVVEDGRVDYQALHDYPDELERYLNELAAVSDRTFGTWTLPQRLSFLINLHNATVLKMVAARYPVSSFRRVAGLFRDPWAQPVVRVFESRITLAALRDTMIRRSYAEPGVHLALCPAAVGGPPLRAEPYVPERFYEQIEEQLTQFLADERLNRVDQPRKRLYLSPLFRWYEDDFVRRSGSLEGYLRPFLPAGAGENMSIRYRSYDWSLNDRRSIGD